MWSSRPADAIADAIAFAFAFAFAVAVAVAFAAVPCRAAGPTPGGPTPEVLCARGMQALGAGDVEAAIPLLRRALARQPGLTAAGHHLGLALIRQGKLEQGRRALAAAARLDGENPRLLTDLGLAYLAEGNKAWAVRSLRAAHRLAPRDERIRYLLGVTLLRLGAASEAVTQLHHLRFSQEVDREELRAQLGLALYRDGQFESSRQVVSPVAAPLLLGGRSAAARAATQLLRASYEAQSIRASFLSIALEVGGVVDTNPYYQAEYTGPTAVGPVVGGSLTLRPWVDAHNIVEGSVTGHRAFYFDATSTDDLGAGDATPSDVGATVGYTRRWVVGDQGGGLHLGLAYGLNLFFLDGGPPLADPNRIFYEQHGGHVTLARLPGDGGGGGGGSGGGSSKLRYSFTRTAFYDRGRSNWGNELSVEHSTTLDTSWFRLMGWLALRHELADAVDYEALIPGAGIGASVLAPLDLVLGVQVGYEHENYYRSAPYDGARRLIDRRWGRQRVDNELTLTAEAGRAIGDSWRVRAVYRRLQNLSTVASFDIAQDLLSLQITWSYQ
jgi:cytochrome c-type biogenesis protein CcmH/NrfG